jgi:chromate reductase, NAD(P)H dehydrogenase (quinone)
MATSVKILGISGSLRQASYNTALLRAAAELLPAGATLDIHDISDLPMYNGDLEAGELPEPVRRLKQAIEAADALLLATPEYNYSVPAALKNALDWASRPPRQSSLNGKPAAIMGAGGRFGTARAQSHLRYIGLGLSLLLLNKPEMMVPAAWEKFDQAGNLTDEATGEQLRQFGESLVSWTRLLRGEKQ